MSDGRRLRDAAWRGFRFGARIGVIIWCLLFLVSTIVYVTIAIVAWYKQIHNPELPDGWFWWIRALGSAAATLVLIIVYSAIAGALVTLTADILRRLRSQRS